MNIPTENFEIKIGPYTYEVVYSDDVAREGNCFGSTHNNEQKIYLQKTGTKNQKREQTFIHELIHACSWISGIVYRFDNKDHPPLEEDMAREISTVFYQVLKDNPEIFKNG